MVREGFTEKVTFEQRLVRGEEVSEGGTQGKSFRQKERLEQRFSKCGLHSDQQH